MLLNSLSVLVITCVALLVYEVHRYRDATVRSVSTIGDIVAENSVVPLLYDDDRVAQELLDGLHFEPEISGAALFDNDGQQIAAYRRDGKAMKFPEPQIEPALEVRFANFSLQTPVMQAGQRVGTW